MDGAIDLAEASARPHDATRSVKLCMYASVALNDAEEKRHWEEKAPLSGAFSSAGLRTSTQWLALAPALRRNA